MDYITVEMLRELKSVGFSYPAYEHELNYGMIFYYQDAEYFIGGSDSSPFSQWDNVVAQNGEWLPDSPQLLEWLKNTHFQANITLNANGGYCVMAIDLINNSTYSAESFVLSYALATVIRKICKSNKREYIPEETLMLSIIE